MATDYERIGMLIGRAFPLPNYPSDDDTTGYVIANNEAVFTTHGQVWKVTAKDLERHFAKAYPQSAQQEWNILYRTSGERAAEQLEHRHDHPGLSDHAVKDIKKLMQSDGRDDRLIGFLFLEHASDEVKNALLANDSGTRTQSSRPAIK